MKKLLFIIPIIFGTFCITPSFAEDMCTPETCITERDDKIVGGCECTQIDITEQPDPDITDKIILDIINNCECTNNTSQCTINGKTYIIEWTKDCYPDVQNLKECPKVGTECTSHNPHSTYAECTYVLNHGKYVPSCAAKTCESGYHLWFWDNQGTGKYSMGVCRNEQQAQSYCTNWCTDEYKDKNCTPVLNGNRTTIRHNGTRHNLIDAFIGCEHETNNTPKTPDSDPTPNPQTDTGCDLTFADGQTIENVDWAESAKPGYDDTDNKITLINTPVRNITSIYTNKDKEIIKQNESGFVANYDENAPHLFDLTHINNSQIPQTERDKYTDAVAIIFKCNNGKPEITPIVSVPVPGTPNPNNGTTLSLTCERGTQCQKFDVFSAIDEQISYLQGRDFFTGSSVWKTDAGKFNTARLASDSIAGVVLGTAGGIITSKIVKKNQIKNGFEDLKCTIGGQVVATYGDEFTVSIK